MADYLATIEDARGVSEASRRRSHPENTVGKSRKKARKGRKLTKAEYREIPVEESGKGAARKSKTQTKSPRKAARRSAAAPRKSAKRSAAAKAAATRKRSAAAKKAAATRKRNAAFSENWKLKNGRYVRVKHKIASTRPSDVDWAYVHQTEGSESRRSPKRRQVTLVSARKPKARARITTRKIAKGRTAVTVHLHGVASPKRRSSVSKRRYMRNPITGSGEWGVGLLGFLLGGMGTTLIDRVVTTHSLTTASGQGGPTDTPAAGQLYNVEAPTAPLWSSWTRLAVAAVAVAAPFGLAGVVKNNAAKSFLQLWGFGALAQTGLKAGNDTVAMLVGKTSFGSQYYAPEISAQADFKKVSAAGVAALPALPAPMLAGVPARLLPRALGIGTPHAAPQPTVIRPGLLTQATVNQPAPQAQQSTQPASEPVSQPATQPSNRQHPTSAMTASSGRSVSTFNWATDGAPVN